MKNAILSLLFVFFCHEGNAQNGIVMSSKHYKENIFVPENTSVKIQTKEGHKYKGDFQITVLNNLWIEGEIIELEQIRYIAVGKLNKGRNVAGGVMVGLGVLISAPLFIVWPGSSGNDIADCIANVWTAAILIIGVPLTVGGIILLAKKTKYMHYDWTYNISEPLE
jgi:hypothetical protein